MYKRIIFIDPSLSNQYSHNYRYAQMLKTSFPAADIHIFCSKAFNADIEKVSVSPTFTVNMYDEYAFVHESKFPSSSKDFDPRVKVVADLMTSLGFPGEVCGKIVTSVTRFTKRTLGTVGRLIKLNRAEYETPNTLAIQLFDALDKANPDESTLVIFPTALFSLLEALITVRLMNDNKPWAAKASFILHFDQRHFANGYTSHAPRLFNKRVVESLPFSEVQLCATNKPLQEKLKLELNTDTVLIDDLISPDSLEQDGKETGNKLKSDSLSVIIPGRYMWDKNFEAVPQILAALADSQCTFMLHASVLQHIHLDEALLANVEVYYDVPGSNEWLSFISSFDCVIIPYGEHYKYRISGILTEAKFVNVPVIISSVTADSTRVNQTCTFERFSEIPNILSKIKRGDIHGKNAFTTNLSEDYAKAIVQPELFVETKHKPVAIQIKPAWVHCGSTLVFENQLEYLLQNDYFVIEVLVKNIVWDQTKEQVAEAYDLLIDNRKDYGGMLAHVVRPNPSVLDMLQWVLNVKTLGTSGPIGKFNFFMKSVGIPAILKKLSNEKKVELVICNHVYHLGLAERFLPKKTICETHDIQSKQYQIRGILPDEFAFNKSIDEELQILENSANTLVNISAYEHFFFSKRVNKPSVLCKPYRENNNLCSTRHQSLADWLNVNVDEEILERLKESIPLYKSIPLFFVGDGHHANISSVGWFIRDVLKLIPNTTLFLAGTISQYFYKELGEHPQICYLGYVKSLDNVYDFVDVAVLPDIEGAGIPIKTVEVLCAGAVFSATATAMRGVDWKRYGFAPTNSAVEFAEDINRLLTDKELANQRKALATEMSGEFTKDYYYAAWDKAIAYD